MYSRGDARSGSARGRGGTRTPRRNYHGGSQSSSTTMGDHVLWKGSEVDSCSSISSGSKHTSSSSRDEPGLEGIAIVQDGNSSGDSTNQPKESRERGTKSWASAAKIREERDVLPRPDLENMRSMPYEELVDLLPKDDEGKPGSIGSIEHGIDACNPCAFMNRSRGCKQGIYCGFCHHISHSEEVDKVRKNCPRKAQRMRFQKTVDRLKSQVEENPVEFNADDVQFPPSIEENTEKKEKVKAMLKDHQLQTIALNVVDKYNEDKAMQGKMTL